MDVYDLTVPQLIHTLGNLTMWLDLAAATSREDQPA